MRVFVPKGAKCQKCGGPLAFRLLESSHAKMHGTYGIKVEMITELFVGHTIGKNYKNEPYTGELPPWE